MQKIATYFPEAWIIVPDVFKDERGFFFESYSKRKFAALGIDDEFVQDNYSRSTKGTVRGLHFQAPPGQLKVVRCTLGAIWDVIVDIRPDSPTFKQWAGTELTEQNKWLAIIPIGFAHGFSVISEVADVEYKVSTHYDGTIEREVRWNDPLIGVDWKVEEPIVSRRDLNAPLLEDYLRKCRG